MRISAFSSGDGVVALVGLAHLVRLLVDPTAIRAYSASRSSSAISMPSASATRAARGRPSPPTALPCALGERGRVLAGHGHVLLDRCPATADWAPGSGPGLQLAVDERLRGVLLDQLGQRRRSRSSSSWRACSVRRSSRSRMAIRPLVDGLELAEVVTDPLVSELGRTSSCTFLTATVKSAGSSVPFGVVVKLRSRRLGAGEASSKSRRTQPRPSS